MSFQLFVQTYYKYTRLCVVYNKWYVNITLSVYTHMCINVLAKLLYRTINKLYTNLGSNFFYCMVMSCRAANLHQPCHCHPQLVNRPGTCRTMSTMSHAKSRRRIHYSSRVIAACCWKMTQHDWDMMHYLFPASTN